MPRKPLTEEQKARRREQRRQQYASEPHYRNVVRAANKRWEDKHPERMQAARQKWVSANRDHYVEQQKSARQSEAGRAYQRAYKETHKERITALNAARYQRKKAHAKTVGAAWRQANKERIKANAAAWRKANQDMLRAMRIRRRARKRNAEGSYDIDDIQTILIAQRRKCSHPWCRKSLKDGYDIDHIIALSKGGSNWPKNLQLLCASCNRKKHTKDPIEFAQEHDLLL